MSFKIEKNDLFEIIQSVYPIVPQKTSLQILSNLKISLRNNNIEVNATDLDHFICSKGNIKGKGESEITVNAKKIFEVVRELQDGEVKIEIGENIIKIESGDSFSCKIAGSNAEDFPLFPEISNTYEIDIKFEFFKKMVQKSSFAVSRDEVKACLCGVLWEVDKNYTSMVATDGHRLGCCKYEDGFNISEKITRIVSPKTLLHIIKVIDSEDPDKIIHTSIGEQYIIFNFDNIRICSKLIEGPYPDYQKVIPQNNPKVASIEKNSLLEAVKRVSVLSSQKNHLVKFNFTNNNLEILVHNRDIGGEARQKLDINYKGDDITIGFNSQYFNEILNMIDTKEIKIEMNTQISPCLLLPTYNKNENSAKETFLIMPLRIIEEG